MDHQVILTLNLSNSEFEILLTEQVIVSFYLMGKFTTDGWISVGVKG